MNAEVQEWMTREVTTVSSGEPVEGLIGALAAAGLGSVPVVDRGVLVGVVSRADLVRALALDHSLGEWMLDTLGDSAARADELGSFVGQRLEGRRVEQVMTAAPATLDPKDDLRAAARLFAERGIHHAPVCEQGRLVGVLSTLDVARWVASGDG